MAHEHSVYDTDTHFEIDPETREISTASGNSVIMQHDHNSERFTFELPRYVDGHDMSTCNRVRVHYINIDASTRENKSGVYDVVDLQVSETNPEKVVCSWLVSQNATTLVGSLNFRIAFTCIGEDSTVEYAWHTAIYKGLTVSDGIFNSEIIVEQYADVLEAWKKELNEAAAVCECDNLYYPSLALAVEDINADATQNAVAKSAAKVKVFTAADGVITAQLMDDTAESDTITVEKNIRITLGSKKLTFTSPTEYLNIAEGASCAIQATDGGIYKEYATAVTTAQNLIKTAGKLEISGGTVSHIGNNSGGVLVVNATATAELVMDGVTVHGENTSTASGSLMRTMQLKAPNVEVRKCSISAQGAGTVYAVIDLSTESDMRFEACTISADSSAGVATGASVNGTARFFSCAIYTDATNDSADRAHSVGIYNNGTVNTTDTYVYGTQSAVTNNGKLYVNGGKLSGFSHGGAYLVHGADGLAYIHDAELTCGEYDGKYDSTAFSSGAQSSLYIGEADATYMDGCAFGDNGNFIIVMRGTGAETNNTLNISRCTIPEDTEKAIRVDAAGNHHLHLGYGGNITAANTNNAAAVEQTNMVYRLLEGTAQMRGADWNALILWMLNP